MSQQSKSELIFIIIIDFLLIVSLSLLVFRGTSLVIIASKLNNRQQSTRLVKGRNLIKNKYICFWLMHGPSSIPIYLEGLKNEIEFLFRFISRSNLWGVLFVSCVVLPPPGSGACVCS